MANEINPPTFLQASTHPAEGVRRALGALANADRAGVAGAGDLAVSASSGMNVSVAAGRAIIKGSESSFQGVYICDNQAAKTVAITAANSSNPRKDLIVAKVQDSSYSGATNAWSIAVVTGTAGANPSAQAPPANSITLAEVYVSAGVTSIVSGNITNKRQRATALGGITVCTTALRPSSPSEGDVIYDTTDDELYIYTGAAWKRTTGTTSWTTFTPSWVNVTEGNGTNEGAYLLVGNTLHFRAFFQFGTTSSVAASPAFIGLDLPAGLSLAGSTYQIVSAMAYDNSTTHRFPGAAYGPGGGTSFTRIASTGAGGGGVAGWTAVLPFASLDWVTGDHIIVQGTVEVA